MSKRKWFPWRRSRDEPEPDTAAIEILREAKAGLSEAKVEQAHANILAIELRAMRRRNHFGEAIEHAYRGNHA